MSLPVFALDKLEFHKIRATLAEYLSTPSGSDIVAGRTPVADTGAVVKRLRESGEMLRLLESSEPPPIQTLQDISDALSKSRIERFLLDGITLSRIGKWAVSARTLRSFFSGKQEEAPALWETAGQLTTLKDLERRITNVVDDKGEIRPDASPELARISRQINNLKQQARNALNNIMRRGKESGIAGDDEITLRGGRLVIPVKSEHKRKVKGFIHDTSATGQTVYIEPVEVFEKNNEIRELESSWKREVERLLREVTGEVGAHSDPLSRNTDLIGYIDACYATARLGQRWQGTIPEITGDGYLSLKECRNPLLLLKFNNLKEGKKNVVPLHLEMDPDEKGIIITGPNAGGKSVTLKTFGLTLALAQFGVPVPALEGARLPCVSGLYMDMGDEQSIDNDLSTFSSRLYWMKQVLQQSDPGSWVLIDEAGSGTDPDEGTALALAFLEQLASKGVRCIATTHHGALKTFAHETLGWSNASMEFDQKTLSPTYRFRKGIPGSSYAFEIAERLELPEEMTRRARAWVGSGKNKMESLILSLEQESQELEERKKSLEKQEQSRRTAKEELDKRLAKVQQERDAIRSKAVEEAGMLLSDANRKIEEAIRAATEKDKALLKEKREAVSDLQKEVQKRGKRKKLKRRQPDEPKKPPQPGDSVRLIDSNTTGELIEVSGSKAIVNANGFRLKTRYDNLERTEKQQSRKKSAGYKLTSPGSGPEHAQPFSHSLDIRGKRGDEAVREVTRYVDEGLSRGMEQLMIIHGKGDGILRKLVHEHLGSRGDVKHFEAAPIEEGGDGCTYVYL